MKNIKITITGLVLFFVHLSYAQIPSIGLDFKNASATTLNSEIVISTGKVVGKWKWTGKGFVTTGFKNVDQDKEWVNQNLCYLADWDLSLFEGTGILKSLNAEVSTDDGFTSEHIKVAAEINYPNSEFTIRYEIWAYPNAQGFRTQLFLKATGRFWASGTPHSNDYRADYLPVSSHDMTRQAIGFLNNHDGRNEDYLDFVEQTVNTNEYWLEEEYKLSNILFLYNNDGGVGLVKESHKVVNREGVNTGIFKYNKNGLISTGWGASLIDVNRKEYTPCWAGWRICWAGGEDKKQLALKTFDRMRYPVIESDRCIVTNVWGGGRKAESAYEENILKEIASSADLGIDAVQIDAGWSKEMDAHEPWLPSKKVYPEGWLNIKKLADEKGVKLGLWNTAERIDKFDGLLTGLNDEGFLYYKIDISTWNSYRLLQSLTQKARELVLHSDFKARVNWDITHKGLRVGYFYNREYGNLFLHNRRLDEAMDQDHLSHVYIPRRILKDQWTFAPYLNLNQLMFNVITTDLVNNKYSNAYLYGDVYSFAIAMMSSPLYFAETWRFDPEDRAPVRDIIRVYKAHREELYNGYVFTLGDRPDDTSWTGFQNYHPDENIGYLTLFREIDNKDKKKRIQLHFIKGKTLTIEDLMTGKKKNFMVDDEGYVEFSIESPASFKFYKYQIENNKK